MADELEAEFNKFSLVEEEKTDLVIEKAWVDEGDIGDHTFVFQFEDESERGMVLVKQLWAFNKSLLVLNEFDGVQSIGEVDLNWYPFWVQIYGLPISLMTERIGIVLGEYVGAVEEVNLGENATTRGKCLRVRVLLNVNKPLKRLRIYILKVMVLGRCNFGTNAQKDLV
ncbi:hypothetical protein PTKIN_Ptkin13bG0197000 [Pterospermum kingtungense]